MNRPLPNTEIEWKISSNLVDYAQAIDLMEERVFLIQQGKAPELIWLLEHPSIYTKGTSAKDTDILEEKLCPVYTTGRGGQVTYHGPGQRVVYLMLDLQRRNPDIRAYVYNLEEWVIKSLAIHNIEASRRTGRVGLWISKNATTDNKIAAIGVRVKKWITMHGLCVNINPDLSFYNGIVPCGIKEHGVTSIQAEGSKISMADFDSTLKEQFHKIF